MFKPAGVVKQVSWGAFREIGGFLDKSKICMLFELSWKGQAAEGDSPVRENLQTC